jgi:hypothetical protein
VSTDPGASKPAISEEVSTDSSLANPATRLIFEDGVTIAT